MWHQHICLSYRPRAPSYLLTLLGNFTRKCSSLDRTQLGNSDLFQNLLMLNFIRCWHRPKFVHIYVLYEYSYLDVPAFATRPSSSLSPPSLPTPAPSPNSPKLLPELWPPAWMYYHGRQCPSTQSLHFSRQGQPRSLVGFPVREAWAKRCVLPNICLFPSMGLLPLQRPHDLPAAITSKTPHPLTYLKPPDILLLRATSQRSSQLGAGWWEWCLWIFLSVLPLWFGVIGLKLAL